MGASTASRRTPSFRPVVDALRSRRFCVFPTPPCPRRPARRRLVAFIRRHTSADGTVGRTGGDADYPNYATALAVDAMVTAQRRSWTGTSRRWSRGCARSSSARRTGGPRTHGLRRLGNGGTVRRPPDAGHVDLSMTRFVLEALRASGVPGSDPAATRARMFHQAVAESRRRILLSPVMPALNKAGQSADGFVSCGTTTTMACWH